mgnify:CR=1 FL=1
MADSKGVWIDTDTNKVVRSEPVNGRLIVGVGEEITDAVQATIDRYEGNHDEIAADHALTEPVTPVSTTAAKKAPAKS